MKHQNDKQYNGTFAGIEVAYTLHGFTPEVAETFNKILAEEGRHEYERGLSVKEIRPADYQD